jgi:ubiquinone/menaquinone biosynthesis C-methylase UbiE
MVENEDLTSNRIYDRLAENYAVRPDETYTQFLKYALLERFCRCSDICLDIGIGNGILSIPVSALVREVHGVEISPRMIEECRKNMARAGVDNVYVCQRSATHLPFEDAFFDLVFSYSTLLLIRDIGKALEEIRRVLKPGGLAILDITGKHNLSQRHWNKYYLRNGHWGIHSFALGEIEESLQDLGMDIVERHATGFLDQWKYVVGANATSGKFLDRLFHRTRRAPDLDYKISQIAPRLANRWYFVLRKRNVP